MSTDRRVGEQSYLAESGLTSEPAIVESLAAASPIGLVVVGPDSTVQWVDESAAEFFGLESGTGVGMERSQFLDSHVLPCLDAPEEFPDSGTTTEDESVCHVLPSADRSERWLRYDSTPITTGDLAGGRLEQYVDVTGEQTRDRFEQYQSIAETTDHAVYVVNSDSTVEYANPAARELADRSLSAITGEPLCSSLSTLFADQETTERLERILDAVFETDGNDSETVELQLGETADRQTYCFECIRTESGTRAIVTARDVSVKRQRERRYKTLVENFPNGAVTLVDEELRYQLVGGKLFDVLDETPETVTGAKVSDVSAGDREVFVESYRDALNGEQVTVETEVEDRLLVHRTLPVYDDDGVVRTAIGMTQDVTDRRRREEELRWKSRALDEAPVGVTITDPGQADNPIIYANHRFREQSGYDAAEILGRNCRFMQGEDTDAETVDELRTAIDAEQPVSVEIRNYRNDGTEFWNHLEIAPVRDDEDALVNYVGFQQDVTERKEREQELEESRNRYRTLVENFPNGAVALVDEELRYITVGGTPLDDTDATVSELQGNSLEDALPSDIAETLLPRYVAAFDGEQSVFEEKIGTRTYRFRIVPVRNDEGEVFVAMGVSQDITAERTRERELREMNQVLDVALEETETGIWVLDYADDTVTTFGKTTDLHGLASDRHDVEAYLETIHPEDRPVVEDALRTAQEHDERFDIEYRVLTDEGRRWVHSRGTVSGDGSETHTRMLGVVTDITARKHRERALEKRERVLNELHTATREFYPPGSPEDIGDFLVEFTENAFDVDYVSVKEYDEETGALVPAVRSAPGIDADSVLGRIEPGANPIWEAYRTGEIRLFPGTEVEHLGDEFDASTSQLLVAPVGDFGVLTAVTTAKRGFDDVDIDLVDVLTANAESAFQRLRTDKVHSTITDELSAQQSRIAELNSIIDAVQAVQRRLADSDSQDALETGVCEELLEMDRVDFGWIGQPTGTDTDLSPTAWAGDGDGYLDSVLTDSDDPSLPARQAADSHDVYGVSNISEHVFDESWAKEALSYGFKSVASVPLLYDGVLYGVLTVYSHTEAAFDGIYETLLADVASLVVNYSRILEQRQAGTQQMHTELEFTLGDETFPLQRLATATDATIRFDTVAEREGDTVRILVTVVDGDAATVLEQASSMTSIEAAEWFGAVEHNQLSLLLRKPFLESVVSKHAGKLLEATSGADGTTFRVELPANVSYRPILDSLISRYDDLDLVAKRQRRTQAVPDARQVEDLLTERQHEILNAAFYGGYYETPRRVKGEDLAESFGISGPAVYNHLQAAHRRVLEAVFEPAAETNE
ncbi:PAS domain S-box protein [Salinibaculum rarum]|uniref:PAS domain S-box protein n=1 Tax=Salinibaculum rarum TaxID=3058903 RepID=UPI00265DDBB9|nr:PAS domain S-box protein [Salinibaculum sp. KK48]